MHKIFVAYSLLGLLTIGCNNQSTNTRAPAASAEDIGEVVASVNGYPVGSLDFEKAAARAVPADGEELSSEERLEVIDGLIADKILYLEALNKGLDADPKVQKVMINTLLRQEVYAQVRNSDFDEDALKAYYDSHPEEFLVPEKVQLKRILIRVNDDRPEDEAKKIADDARRQVAGDPKETFKDVASKVSEDPYRRRGGDVGFISMEGKPGLDAKIVLKAFELDVGEVSEVFRTSDGFNIIYIANKRERVERSFQQMKGSVLRKVKNAKLKELYEQYVAQLREGTTVEVNEDKVEAIEIKRAIKPTIPAGMQLAPLTPGDELGEEDITGE